ncbi:hypothetical protein ABPG74_000559 [Tetrahymena malaccensis]
MVGNKKQNYKKRGNELESYRKKINKKTHQSKMAKSKDDSKPAPPKRPLSAFFLFKQHNYDQVKKENPNAKITELTSMIAEKWKSVGEKEKKKYETLQSEAKAKYEKDMQAYEKKYGKPEKQKKIKKSKKGSK